MTEVLERGDAYFFYRPRVGVAEVSGLRDVQRLFVILKPDGDRRYRRLIVGRKRLPDPGSHEREWAFVAEVTDDPAEWRQEIEHEPRARPAGEGRYAIVDHGGHTHLAFPLAQPPDDARLQRELNVPRAGRDPAASSRAVVGRSGSRRAAGPTRPRGTRGCR